MLFLLGLLPAIPQASWVDFASPLTITNGYPIEDRSDPFFGIHDPFFGTSLSVEFTGTTGVWLSMDARHDHFLHYAPVDEYFNFTLKNSSGTTIDKLSLEFSKPHGFSIVEKPDPFFWATAITDHWTVASWGQVKIDWGGVEIVETESSVRAELPFQEGYQWGPDKTIYFNLDWNQFNTNRTDWLLNIDPNEIDFNNPTEPDIVALQTPVPIPGAAWLFGGSLLVVLTAGRRRRSR